MSKIEVINFEEKVRKMKRSSKVNGFSGMIKMLRHSVDVFEFVGEDVEERLQKYSNLVGKDSKDFMLNPTDMKDSWNSLSCGNPAIFNFMSKEVNKEKYHLLRLTLDGAEAVSEKFTDSAAAEQAAAMCKGAAVICTSVTKEQKKEQPPKLYDLTTLQREANRLLGYTAKQTLDYAQSLYEKKLLTYPRTDSRHLTSDMAETVSCVIHLAAKLPPFDGCTNFFPLVEAMVSDKDVSDHHAIIPTMEIEKADIPALPLGERELILLICCRLLCASAESYVYETVTAAFDCGGHSFTAKGRRVLSEGWREIDRIFRASLKEKPADGDGGALPDFTEGQTFDGAEVSVTEHFTQPPKPYTEDTLLSLIHISEPTRRS